MVEEHIDGAIRYNQPAGHLEDGESLVDAAVRECREETACDFSPSALVGIYRWRHDASGDTFLRATFCGPCSDPREERELDRDIVATHWLEPDDIRARERQLRSPLVLRSIDDYLAGRRYPLELLVELDRGHA